MQNEKIFPCYKKYWSHKYKGFHYVRSIDNNTVLLLLMYTQSLFVKNNASVKKALYRMRKREKVVTLLLFVNQARNVLYRNWNFSIIMIAYLTADSV